MKKLFEEATNDLPASLVVFFVSIPLCLGVSLASGAPLLSGLVAGVLGGVVCGILSKSPLAVTGPAAGLAAVALFSIERLGSFSTFLLAVVVAGIIQIVLGLLKAGSIGRYFPVSVVKGMLAGIGLILIVTQIPHALGDDVYLQGAEGDEGNLREIIKAITDIHLGAVLVTFVSMIALIVCGQKFWQGGKWTRLIPGPLVAVLLSVLLNELFIAGGYSLALTSDHLVTLPHMSSWTALPGQLSIPDFDLDFAMTFAMVSATIAIVASVETVLNIEAVDKLDPYRRTTSLNHELIAQGSTNILSGMLGGLPVTAVIARSSLNINAGARTKLSTIVQAILLALAVLASPGLLERIPVASLAVILIVTGYRLAPISRWKSMYQMGQGQFVPFVVTALMILFSNLLTGLALGLVVAVFFVLKSNFGRAVLSVNRDGAYLIKFTKDVSFVNKLRLYEVLESVPAGCRVYIDGTRAHFIDHDIIETIEDYQKSAPVRNITVEIVKKSYAIHPFFKTEQ